MTGSPVAAGNLAGLVDGLNGRGCRPRERFAAEGWPDDVWPSYSDGYLKAYTLAERRARELVQLLGGA